MTKEYLNDAVSFGHKNAHEIDKRWTINETDKRPYGTKDCKM